MSISSPKIRTTPITESFGVEIHDIDLSAEMPIELFEQIRRLYDHHSLVLFRDQQLTPADQARLAHLFGKPKIETRKQFNFVEHPEVSTIGNITDDEGKPLSFFVRGGFGWHTDGSAACHVDAATFLYAVEVPEKGGDTLFLSTAVAYDIAPPEIRDVLKGVSVLSSFHAHNDPLFESDPEAFIPLSPKEREALPPVWHRVIQTHPVTGREVFYLNLNPLDFDGIDAERGMKLLEEVLEFASAPDRVYRHHWQPGELIIWDNLAMMHSGTPTHMYEQDRRLMYRSFVYTSPTERPLENYEEVSRIFMPDENSIRLADFN